MNSRDPWLDHICSGEMLKINGNQSRIQRAKPDPSVNLTLTLPESVEFGVKLESEKEFEIKS